jgi:thiamine monophosphate kinase
LLFTAPRGSRVPARIAGVAVRLIGHMTRARGVFLTDGNGVKREFAAKGWEHFKKEGTT